MKRYSLLIFLFLIAACAVEEEFPNEIKFFVNDYKIINDTARSYNSRFARLTNVDSISIWTKLFYFETINSIGLLDSFTYIDSISIEYSLDDMYEISKVHNWLELKTWSENAVDHLFEKSSDSFTPEFKKLLGMATDSSLVITKNIVEIKVYNYFKALQDDDFKKLFERREDENFVYYKVFIEIDEVAGSEYLDLLSGFAKGGLEIDFLTNEIEITTSKKSDEFVMGNIDQIISVDDDTAIHRITVIPIDEFGLDAINQFGN